jgi:hypothetical protein
MLSQHLMTHVVPPVASNIGVKCGCDNKSSGKEVPWYVPPAYGSINW